MDILRLAVVGGLVGLDTAAAFQVMICQPLVGGLLAGWALGEPGTGALVGLLFQGLYLAEFPIGARLFCDGNLAAVQAAALTVFGTSHLTLPLGSSICIAFLWAIPTAVIGGQVIAWTRRLHGQFLPILDRWVAEGRFAALDLLYGIVIAADFAISALLTVILFFIGRQAFALLTVLSAWAHPLNDWGLALRGGLLGAGCAVIFVILVGALKGRKRWLPLIAAILAGGVWAVGY